MLLRRLKIKYFAALAVLMASLLAIGGATYAWFAMNNTAEANGMQIRVKTNASYMLIKAGHHESAAVIKSERKIEDNALTATASLAPAAHFDIAHMAEADAAANWYYKTSDDPSLYGGENHEFGQTLLSESSAGFDYYVLRNEFSITLLDNSAPVTDLRVERCTITTPNGGKKAVKVLVAGVGGAEEFSGDGGAGSGAAGTILAPSVDSEHVVNVKIYIYWDGTNEDVTTDNKANELLKDTSVEVVFTATPTDS